MYATITAALVKQPASYSHALPVASAVAGLVFWPIAYACYIASYYTDAANADGLAREYSVAFPGSAWPAGTPPLAPPALEAYARATSFSQDISFGYGFALAVIANGLSAAWLLHHFAYVRPALAAAAAADEDAKGAAA